MARAATVSAEQRGTVGMSLYNNVGTTHVCMAAAYDLHNRENEQ